MNITGLFCHTTPSPYPPRSCSCCRDALVDVTALLLVDEACNLIYFVGKTEAAKLCVRFFTEASRVAEDTAGRAVSRDRSSRIGAAIADAGPVLEALGNARTMRNPNSSRFGKYIEVFFSNRGALIGAGTSTYLLEKTRVITHGPGERGYHVLYMVCSAPDEVKAASCSQSPSLAPHAFSQLPEGLIASASALHPLYSMPSLPQLTSPALPPLKFPHAWPT